MKKFILVVFILSAIDANAQEKKFVQKVTVGFISGASASTDFSKSEKPFTFNTNLSANIALVTPKTFHNVLYGFGNNSLRSLNGYFLKKNWDVYILYSKILHNDGNYLGVGGEKMFTADKAKILLFGEFGTAFKGKPILTFGMLISVQGKIFGR